jgi:hypothetical protein
VGIHRVNARIDARWADHLPGLDRVLKSLAVEIQNSIEAEDIELVDENLSDVGLAYSAIGRGLTTPWSDQDIADYRSEPLEGRVLELLGLTTLDEDK